MQPRTSVNNRWKQHRILVIVIRRLPPSCKFKRDLTIRAILLLNVEKTSASNADAFDISRIYLHQVVRWIIRTEKLLFFRIYMDF